MKLSTKIESWLKDYAYMLRGALTMIIHGKPPEHYLGYVLPRKINVILIPGILGKWGFMKHLGDRISLEGYPVHIVPKLGYNIFSIHSGAQKLKTMLVHMMPGQRHIAPRVHSGAEHIKELMGKEKLDRAVLVAHSKGGLIGKYFLAHKNSDNKIMGMVAIATPFSGSEMVKLLPINALLEMSTDSKIIRDLEKHTEVNKQIVSIIPEYDNHVWSKKGSFLNGAENIKVPVSGHHRVLFSKEVEEVVLKSIEKLASNFIEPSS